MSYIGNTPQTQGFTPAIDYFNGNGVTVTFTLSRPIASVAQVIVAVDNVIQNPSSAFGVVGNSITFTSAPLSGTNNIWVEYTSLITTYQGISQDPTVIGDIRATGGYLAEGDFGNSFVDGNLIDYVTGAGRLTVGELDDLVFYHGGTSARSEMMRMSYAGNSYVVGNLGVGATTSPASQLEVKSAAFTDSVVTINSTSTNVSQRLNFTANGTLQTQLYDDSTETRLNAVTSKPMTFRTANTERMRITSDGLLQFNSGYGSVATAYGVRAWCNFNGTGTPSIRAGGNVSSITDRAVGEYDVNFTNAMPDANYSFQGNRMYRGVVNAEGNTTTYARIYVAETDPPYPFDPQFCYIAIIR